MSQTLVRAAFEQRLATWAAAQTEPIPVAYQGVEFDPPAGRYFRAFLLPNTTNSNTLDQTHRQFRGIFQVSIVMPAGAGLGGAEALVSALDELFTLTAPITSGSIKVVITSPMSAATAINEDGRMVVPVSCGYQADVTSS